MRTRARARREHQRNAGKPTTLSFVSLARGVSRPRRHPPPSLASREGVLWPWVHAAAPASAATHLRRGPCFFSCLALRNDNGAHSVLPQVGPLPGVAGGGGHASVSVWSGVVWRGARRREGEAPIGGCAVETPPPSPPPPHSRDYPTTVDDFDLLEECGRGVSATVSVCACGEEEEGERDPSRDGRLDGAGRLAPLSRHPNPTLTHHHHPLFPTTPPTPRSTAPSANRTTRSSR